MNASILRAAGPPLALLLLAYHAPLLAAAASPPPPAAMPVLHLPSKPLHVQLVVEVNKRGQVVRVAHGALSGDQPFDTMALGNAMQMWIRRPNGTAQTGLYRVSYDYDPRTHQVSRVPTLMRAGGAWANTPGAATLIIQDARRQVQALEARLRAEQAKQREQQSKNLPDINAAVRRAVKPTPHP